jgi:dihydroorotase
MAEILISGGTIVGERGRFVGYVLVRDGVIAEVGEGEYSEYPELPHADGPRNNVEPRSSLRASRSNPAFSGTRIDATGLIVMPGVIDPHVHFREPGLTAKGDMESESAAAVAGGVTTVLEMPNTSPPATSMDLLAQKFDLAEGRMHTNYSFFLGATVDNLREIKLFEAGGGRLVKLFMGSSTGGMLVEDGRALAALFAEFGGVIAAHCEDEQIIRSNIDTYKHRLGYSATAAIHPLVRSNEACYVATARAVELADRYGSQLHVCHVTTARELALFDSGFSATRNLKKITAEACVPHLWFTDDDYARLSNRIKCNPAIKSAADRVALRAALTSPREGIPPLVDGVPDAVRGKIDLIATDHAPHTADEKARGYWDSPSGMPSVQFALPVMFELVAQGVVTLETVVERMCHAPAERFGIAGRGFLQAGYAADIVIVDPAFVDRETGETGWVVGPENILSRCGWSPWEGTRFSARVVTTLVNGRLAWNDKIGRDATQYLSAPAGQRLSF